MLHVVNWTTFRTFIQLKFHLLNIFSTTTNIFSGLAQVRSVLQSKKRSMCILGHIQSTFFFLGKFLKKVTDDQSSSITKGSIYYIEHMSIQPFTAVVD